MGRKDAIQELRDILIRRREALRKALAGDLSLLKELAEQSMGDVVDFALDSSQDEINSQIAEAESRELANIDAALDRMRKGTYGACDSCDGAIPMTRLQAIPYATCCIECQREIERGNLERGQRRNWGNLLGGAPGDQDSAVPDFELDVS